MLCVDSRELRKRLSVESASLGDLEKKRRELEKQITNLLVLAEEGGNLESVRDRLSIRESELRALKLSIQRSKTSPVKQESMTLEWIQDQLVALHELTGSEEERGPRLRHTLQELFPEKLKVKPHKTDQGVSFEISGPARPLATVGTANLQKRIIAVQGLEPRSPSGSILQRFERQQFVRITLYITIG